MGLSEVDWVMLLMNVVTHSSLLHLFLFKTNISLFPLLSTQLRSRSVLHIQSTNVSRLVGSPAELKFVLSWTRNVCVLIDCSQCLHLLLSFGLIWFFFSWLFLDPKHALLFLDGNTWKGFNHFSRLWWFRFDVMMVVSGFILWVAHEFDELIDWIWAFRLEILAFLHRSHLMMQLKHQTHKLFFVCCFALVELDYALLQNV
jgi:hypothetical protein